MLTPQFFLPIHAELIVDLFAGGGGASTGIEQAIGYAVDIAINHDPEAISLHQANHPQTAHFCSDVFEVDPVSVTKGQPVGLLWASPDCKHFSKAKGGKPVSKKIRSLAWVVVKWAKAVKPRVICLENVEEFKTWGPLNADNKPCAQRKGQTFKQWISSLQALGYQVEWREMRASDYGAPTIRKRLFLVARCDGMPIVWPDPTHGIPNMLPVKNKKLKAWRTAAECIDWNIPVPSIFERKKPLADATCRRIAKGIMRYVVESPNPFIVSTLIQTGYGERSGQSPRVPGLEKPIGTLVGNKKHALVSAFIVKHYTGVIGSDMVDPMATVTSVDHNSLVEAHIQRDMGKSVGHSANSPLATVTAGGGGKSALITAHMITIDNQSSQGGHTPITDSLKTTVTENRHALVTSNIVKLRGTNTGSATNEPLHTISAQGAHHAEVRAFLIKYYGTDQDPRLAEPMHTVPTKDRFGLVTVHGEEYTIVDIGLRMLTPRELYRAQGFPESYQIEYRADGKPLTKTAQVRMCGNSVCPPMAKAIVEANYTTTHQQTKKTA